MLDAIKLYLSSKQFKQNLRYAFRTFVYAFLGIAVPGFLGFLTAVTSWAEAAGGEPFPDATGLLYLAVSAIVAGTIAVVNLVGRVVEDAAGRHPEG